MEAEVYCEHQTPSAQKEDAGFILGKQEGRCRGVWEVPEKFLLVQVEPTTQNLGPGVTFLPGTLSVVVRGYERTFHFVWQTMGLFVSMGSPDAKAQKVWLHNVVTQAGVEGVRGE